MSIKIFSTLVVLLFIKIDFNYAQPITTSSVVYQSQEDQLITIRRLSVLPLIDNVGGIYSRPIENFLIESIRNDHHWEYEDISLIGPLLSPEELEASSEKVKQISAGSQADAIVSSRLVKGPGGISIKMNLFSNKDFNLLSQVEEKNISNFEIKELQAKTKDLFVRLMKNIPYEGIVLSRQGQLVTVNLGRVDGIDADRMISVVQIIKLNRHPKFNFIISAEKEVLGKIKLVKVDETLSFGKIVTEKEKGVIQKDSKISGIDFVKYSETNSLSEEASSEDQIMNRPDSLISFGKGATEWLPPRNPTFGLVYAGLGNSLFNYSTQQAGGLSDSSLFNPFIHLGGELWISPNWTIYGTLRQGIVSLDNPLPGSTPSDLSASMSLYEMLLGYKLRLGSSVWGPQIDFMAGMSTYDLKVDDSSPRSVTSTKYSGLKLGLRGHYPIDLREEWSLGANLFFFFDPSLRERPVASGTGEDNAINQFGVFVNRKLSVNLRAQVGLDFELYKTNFDAGSTSTSISQKLTTMNVSLAYLF